MTKNKDPMLQELGTSINNRTATQKAHAPLIEDTLSERDDLQKRVAELEERHRSILSKIEMVRRDRDYWMTKYQTDILGFNEPAHD